MKHIEKRASRKPAGAKPAGETVTEYFSPDRGGRHVERHELLAILTQFHKAQRQNRWWSRLWRFLMAKVGSGPVHAVEPPTPAVEKGGNT